MPPDMTHVILANMNIKLCIVERLGPTFRKVVRQQMWRKVVVLNPASSANLFWIYRWKNMKIGSIFTKAIAKTKLVYFLRLEV